MLTYRDGEGGVFQFPGVSVYRDNYDPKLYAVVLVTVKDRGWECALIYLIQRITSPPTQELITYLNLNGVPWLRMEILTDNDPVRINRA